MAFQPLRLLPFLAFLALAALACSRAATAPVSPSIVANIPWPDREEASYVLLDDEGVEVAQGFFTVERQGDRQRLSMRFQSAAGTDDTVALVRANDLTPLEVQRVILGNKGELRFQANYFAGVVEILRTTEKARRSDELSVPANAYDSASSLYLWRTIPFRQGYTVTYRNMMTAVQERSRQNTVTLHVIGKERVSVPAGAFDAWRVEVRSGRREIAWYAIDDGQPLVMYDNGRHLFQLRELRRP